MALKTRDEGGEAGKPAGHCGQSPGNFLASPPALPHPGLRPSPAGACLPFPLQPTVSLLLCFLILAHLAFSLECYSPHQSPLTLILQNPIHASANEWISKVWYVQMVE